MLAHVHQESDFSTDGPALPLTFAVLGPLELRAGGRVVDTGPYKQRVLLAVLLLRANTVVSVDQLLEAVWDESRPRTARKNLQVYICALRKFLGERIVNLGYGYLLRAEPQELDLLRFNRLVSDGRRAHSAGDAGLARMLLGDAVRLWRDRALVDLVGNSFVAAESERLSERRLDAFEDWIDLEIEAGHHLDVLEQLDELASLHPLRERLAAARMTALAQGGDRSAALGCYEAYRQRIARELGLAPSAVLQRLLQRILGSSAGAGKPQSSVHGAVVVRPRPKPAQMPRDLPDFVGRTKQVEELSEFLKAQGGYGHGYSDVAMIGGFTGSGKTALAVRIGHLLADWFPDGQVYVSLTDADGAERPWRDVLTELIRGIELDLWLPADESAALALWRSSVAGRQILFVFDNATGERAVRRLLPGSGASRSVVISTRRLGGLEAVHRLEVGEFGHDEAMELLERALGGARVRGTGDAVRRMMAACGGLPLVFRMIAAKLAALRHVSLAEYADRLDRHPVLLDELAVGDLSLRRRFDRFHAGLTPLQKDALRSLSALPGPIFGHEHIAVLEDLMDTYLVSMSDYASPHQPVLYQVPVTFHQYVVGLYNTHRGSVEYESPRYDGTRRVWAVDA